VVWTYSLELDELLALRHTVSFSVTSWDEPPGLPDGVPRTGRISRGQVLDIGQQVRTRTRPATDLLVASFI
jgi:hypothetical protein